MKKVFSRTSILTVAVMLLVTGCKDKLADGFVNPPAEQRTGCYWYWMSDNISKEGVIRDLQAMKKAGITMAFIGNIGYTPDSHYPTYPRGEVKFQSDEWWEITHTALKTAAELDIEIGMFNSPGWSQSGGPWVQPNQTMRYLASSEMRVTGPKKISERLLPPAGDFQDVKTLAFPAVRYNLFDTPKSHISYSDNLRRLQTSKTGSYRLPPEESHINLILPAATVARGVMIYPGDNFNARCQVQVKDGKEFRTVKTFTFDRSVRGLCRGYDLVAPVVESLPEFETSAFRIVFTEVTGESVIDSLILTSSPVIERYPGKLFAQQEGYSSSQNTDRTLSIDPKQVRDISQHLAFDGTITWDVPEGEWVIMRTGMLPTGVVNHPAAPEATGPEVDKMSRKHISAHFDAFIGQIYKRIPAADRRTWTTVILDSYEQGGQNFTDDMIEMFRQSYGYDPVPFFPAYKGYTVGNPELSDRFLWDLRRLVADKIAYNYVGGLRDASHQYGFRTWLENYGHCGFPAEFLQYGGQSDEIGGEFWGENQRVEKRAASSCAHIYNKTRVWAESFTSDVRKNVYRHYPATWKRSMDIAFADGINSCILHVYIQQYDNDDYPGVDAWFGTEFNRKNTWFDHLDLFTTYLRRCGFMLQQGLNVADVAYYIGDDTPKMTGSTNPGSPKGYNYDFINSEVMIRDLTVKDGRLTLPHGTSYRVLVLPPQATMRPEALQKIEQLIADGAIVVGPPPSRSPSMQNYPQADEEIKSLATKIWGDTPVKKREYGKGLILSGMSMSEVFEMLNIAPDIKIGDKEPVLYSHRTFDGTEIYFVANQSDNPLTINPQFRVTGLQPELWDAVTGEIRPLPAFEQKDETTVVPLKLEANGSAFVVFRKKGSPSASDVAANFPEPTVKIPLNSAWDVRFESDAVKRGPSETVTFKELQDWTQSTDERIKYYSGTAVYTTKFKVDEILRNKKYYLDLGKVSMMAKVKVNGKYAGGVWTLPYRLNVTQYLKQGENTLEVEAVNTWVNRIIGDMNLPDSQRKIRPQNNSWQADSPLHTSGLLGPVEIIAVEKNK
jgi:hypothetical protein